ncbi:MAG: uracil-DNA glycosylase [Pseudomonadota bacterium]
MAKAVVPDETVFAEAHQRAASATNLDGLRAALEAFDGCNLKHTARNLAFEGGMRTADIMLVGGAASRDDDETGVPFSGLDGILLRNMFAAIGIDAATQTYQAMCVPWAPPGGGPPTPLHLKLCAPFIARQIALARPKCLVLLGNVAARHMLSETKRTILQLRGQWLARDFGSGETTILVMHDPDFLRRQPSAKRQTWFDLLALQKRLTSA